ncbi:TetR/AcrR family transcriptional regulator [Aquincola sp. MAHUQ-54]|uniref:TetR/AcrR family transcriptional regulator n=1 Tax=Aquincola agrisoli TaxID=3119538 RepID=A0AAW9QEE4_9BURK
MSPAAAPSAAPRQRRKEARPQELLAAALEVFVEKGFANSRSEEVAARAGVSKGTLYLYYPSKEELLKAVIRHYLGDEVAAGGAEIAQHADDDPEVAFGVLARWWQRMYDSPASGVFKLIVTEARNFPEISAFYVSEVMVPGERLIGQMIERGIARGQLRPATIAHVTHSLLLPLVMLCLHKHALGACMHEAEDMVDPHRFIDDHIALVVRSLRIDAPLPK